MYQKYKSGFKEELDVASINIEVDEPDMMSEVSNCWNTIDNLCSKNATVPNTSGNKARAPGWKTVHLFVSSTFRDFFTEREVLVKKVFPILKDWCEERKIRLYECDLRWGVPTDTTTADTICICMEQIDTCFEENEGEPFFLNLTGERYGWIPGKDDVPTDVAAKYSWVDDTSMTFMEVLHGAYRYKNPSAAFFFRDPSVLSEVSESDRTRFVEDTPLAKEHMRVLKMKLKERFPDQTFSYTCKVDAVECQEGDQNVKLIPDDSFTSGVLNFFKSAIERRYSDQKNVTELDEYDQENELQHMFVEQKAETLVGRDVEIQGLLSYAQGKVSDDVKLSESSATPLRKDREVHEDENMLMIIEAPPGYGKSSVMAKVTMEALKTGMDVFYHFVGSTGPSQHSQKLLLRLLRRLIPEPTEEQEKQINEDVASQRKLLTECLDALREKTVNLLIMLDAVNELAERDTYDHLCWLPARFPSGIRCIVSTNNHAPTVARLREHTAYLSSIGHLDLKSTVEITTRTLGKYKKKLDDSQLTMLTSHPCASIPLWLSLMCEELRIYGDFRTLTKRIQSLPESVDGFLRQILERLVQEDETDCMKKVLCLIHCTPNGLQRSEVLNMLGDQDNKIPVPPIHWAQIQRYLRPYIRTFGTRKQYIVFFHEAVRKAVRDYLFSKPESYIQWNTHLADYYETWCEDNDVIRSELPRHLSNALLKKRLVKYLRTKEASLISQFERRRYIEAVRDYLFSKPESYIQWNTHLADYYETWCEDNDVIRSELPRHLSNALLKKRLVKYLRTKEASLISQFERRRYIEQYRCMSLADPIMAMVKGVVICQMCSMKKMGISPHPYWRNSECCLICGEHVVFKEKKAHYCVFHGQGGVIQKCCICDMIVHMPKDPSAHFGPQYGKLCQFCSIGHKAKQCTF